MPTTKRVMYTLKVEGLMMDVTAAEEEIKRWKMAAEEEAEAGKAIEQEFETQVLCYKHASYDHNLACFHKLHYERDNSVHINRSMVNLFCLPT
jgi:hypothetical protein